MFDIRTDLIFCLTRDKLLVILFIVITGATELAIRNYNLTFGLLLINAKRFGASCPLSFWR